MTSPTKQEPARRYNVLAHELLPCTEGASITAGERIVILASDHDATVSTLQVRLVEKDVQLGISQAANAALHTSIHELHGDKNRLLDNLHALQATVAERDARVAELQTERDSYVEKAANNMKLYLDLLMQVVHVVPGETRHESARRIIHQHENQSHGPCQSAALPSPGEAKEAK